MARIVFLPLHIHPDVNSSFGLARPLAARGHEIHYLSVADFGDRVKAQGFGFTPILESVYPAGALDGEQARQARGESMSIEDVKATNAGMLAAFKGGELDRIAKALEPDLFVVAGCFPAAVLAAYGTGVPVAMFWSCLISPYDPIVPPLETALQPGKFLSGLKIKLAWRRTIASWKAMNANFWDQEEELRDLARHVKYPLDQLDFKVESIPHLDALPELVLVPSCWEFPRSRIPRHTFYVEPGVDTRRNDLPFDWAKLDPKKPLIYCAAGGMAPYMHPEVSRRYYDRFHEAIRLRPQWQGLLSVGKFLDPASFAPLPNLVIERAVPQVQVLERAALCMTHGGINTAKEAIYYGVPMVAFPLFYDQFGYAARTVYHGLGLGGDMRKISGAAVAKMMDRVLGDPGFKQRAMAMSKTFRDLQDRSPGADLVERLLAGERPTRDAATPA